MKWLLASVLAGLLTVSTLTPALAREISVTGNLIDSFCYVTMGAHGPSHRKCAISCAKKGMPVSLMEKGTGKAYVLMPSKNDEPLPDSIINNMERQVTVTGDVYQAGGVTYLTVNSVK